MSLTSKLTKKLSEELGLEKEKGEIIAYGMFAFFQIGASLILVAIFGLLLDIVWQALAFSFTASILRQYSGGVHASNPTICLIVGTLATVALAFLSHVLAPIMLIEITLILEATIFIFAYYMIVKYAPVESKAKPIKTIKKRKKMKKMSFGVLSLHLVFIIIFTAMFFLSSETIYVEYSFCISFAILWQVFNLTVIGHKSLATIDSFFKKILPFKKGERT